MNLTVHDSTADTGIAKVAEAAGTGPPPEWEPRPFPQSWWQTRQSREVLTGRLLGLFTDPGAGRTRDKTRRRGLTKLLDWLQRQPGDTWQEKWLASGADAAGFGWADLPLKDRVPARRSSSRRAVHRAGPAGGRAGDPARLPVAAAATPGADAGRGPGGHRP